MSNETKKYEFTGETTQIQSGERTVTLHRIRALRDMPILDVKKGDLGGWLESEKNLSHDSTSWVFGEARVFDEAQVFDEARVFDEAQVFGEAWVFGKARVFGEAQVFGEAWVFNKAQVFGEARVRGVMHVGGGQWVFNGIEVVTPV